MIHWFDIFVLCFLAASAIWSYFRGMAKEIFSILALVAGYIVASRYFEDTAIKFSSITPDETLREILAFGALFFLTVILVVIVGIFFRRLLKISETMSAADKIAGSAVGILKGGIFLAIIAYPLAMIPGLKEDVIGGSRTAPLLMDISERLFTDIAPEVGEQVKNAGESVKKLSKDSETASKVQEVLDKGMKGASSLIKGVNELGTKEKSVAPDSKAKPDAELDRAGMDNLIEKADQESTKQ